MYTDVHTVCHVGLISRLIAGANQALRMALRLPVKEHTGHVWTKTQLWGKTQMKNKLMLFAIKMQNVLAREEGQDLIEYALVVALIAFSATVGMKTLATGINAAFANISTTLGTYIT
jgi:pilus assembly protein Flp/PilA